jgi:hypothetical protein
MSNFAPIYENEKFKSLNPSNQSAVRDTFFETKIAPLAEERGVDVVKAQQAFNKKFDISQNIVGQIKGAAGEALGTLKSKIDNYRNDIDRDTDVNDISFRGQLSRMSGAKEQANFLNMTLGKDNWGVGNEGDQDYAITTKKGMEILGMGDKWERTGKHKGKPIAIDSNRITRSDFFGDMQSGVLPVVGSIAGGVMTGGLGFIPAMAAAGAGGALGTGVREWMQPKKYQLQTGGEIAKDMATEGALAAGGEGIGRMLRPLGRAIMGPNRRRPFTAFGKQPVAESVVAPERIRLADKAIEKDITLPITQATGRQKLTGFFQRLTDTILGDPRGVKNAEGINKWAKEITGENIGTNVAKQKFGEGVLKKSESHAKALAGVTARLTGDLKLKLATSKNWLRGKGVDDLQIPKIRETLESAHDDFMDKSALNYLAPVKALGGGVSSKVFSTKRLVDIAKGKLSTSMMTKEGKKFSTANSEVTAKLNEFANLESHASLNQLMAFRKDLGKSAYTGNLHSDVASHDAMDFLKAVDDIFDDLTRDLKGGPKSRYLSPKYRQALVGLRDANAEYSKGIKPFQDVLVKSITNDLTKTGTVQPSMVINAMKGGSQENITSLMGILRSKNPKLADEVKGKFFDEVIWGKTLAGAEGKRFNPSDLINNIDKLKPGVLKTIYGKEAKEITKLADDLDKYAHGEITPVDIDEGGVVGALGKMVQAQQVEEEFLKSNFAQIAKKGVNIGGSDYGKLVDMAMKDSGHAKELMKIVGEGSTEHTKAQNIMIRKLINNLQDNSDPVEALLKEDGLQNALAKFGAFTSKKGDNAIRLFLGEKKFNELLDLSKVAALTVTKGNSGLVAMSIVLNPGKNIGKLAEINILSRVLNTPGFMKYMVHGFKSPAWRKGTDASVRKATQIIAGYIQDAKEDKDLAEELKSIGQ